MEEARRPVQVELLRPREARRLAAAFEVVWSRARYHHDPPPEYHREGLHPREVRTRAGDDGFRCAVARDERGVLVGFGYGYPSSLPAAVMTRGTNASPGTGFLFAWLAVIPCAQRQGTGRRIHDLVVGAAPCDWAWLLTDSGQTPARRLYDRAGWSPVDRFKDKILLVR